MTNETSTTTIDELEARYDEMSAALRAATGSDREQALADFEKTIEDLREARRVATIW